MRLDVLKEQLLVEHDAMDAIVDELYSLLADVGHRTPTFREQTAGAAFLAQFYTGIENCLKRISVFCDVPLPQGSNWHVQLFESFVEPPLAGLPVLFGDEMAGTLSPYRRFRHVAYHSYGFEIDWDLMHEGISEIGYVFSRFRNTIDSYIMSIDS